MMSLMNGTNVASTMLEARPKKRRRVSEEADMKSWNEAQQVGLGKESGAVPRQLVIDSLYVARCTLDTGPSFLQYCTSLTHFSSSICPSSYHLQREAISPSKRKYGSRGPKASFSYSANSRRYTLLSFRST